MTYCPLSMLRVSAGRGAQGTLTAQNPGSNQILRYRGLSGPTIDSTNDNVAFNSQVPICPIDVRCHSECIHRASCTGISGRTFRILSYLSHSLSICVDEIKANGNLYYLRQISMSQFLFKLT